MIRQKKNYKINTQAESFLINFSPVFHVSVQFCLNKPPEKILHVEIIYTGLGSLNWLWYLGPDSALRGPLSSQPMHSMPESIQHLNISPFCCIWGGNKPRCYKNYFIIPQEIKSKCLYTVPGKYHKDIHKHSYQFTKPNTCLQPCECTITPLPRRPAPTHRHKNCSHSWSPPLPGKSHCSVPAHFVSFSLCKVLPQQRSQPLHHGSCPTLNTLLLVPPQHTQPPRLVLPCPCTASPSPIRSTILHTLWVFPAVIYFLFLWAKKSSSLSWEKKPNQNTPKQRNNNKKNHPKTQKRNNSNNNHSNNDNKTNSGTSLFAVSLSVLVSARLAHVLLLFRS